MDQSFPADPGHLQNFKELRAGDRPQTLCFARERGVCFSHGATLPSAWSRLCLPVASERPPSCSAPSAQPGGPLSR